MTVLLQRTVASLASEPPRETLTEAQQDALAFQAYLDALREDPLKHFHCVSDAQRRFLSYLDRAEVLMRSGHSGGKTWVGAAAAVALLRGVRELDGIRLPELPVPCIGWCLVQTYKAQVDSAQAAVQHWLGDWPHKLDILRSDIAETIWVATPRCDHGMDKRCRTCSKLVFHCAESPSSIGGRIDFGWADEPPLFETWDSFRQRGGAQRRLIRFLTATPKEKKWWRWMADRETGFYDCEERIRDGLVEVRCSIFDNRALSAAALRDKVQSANRSKFKKAILFGDYVDLEGDCPFDVEALERWKRRSWVREPSIERLKIQSEQSFDDGRYVVERAVEVEVFEGYREGESYLGVLDPSSGIKSAAHDPAGLHLYRRGARPALALRINAYLEPYGLGSAAATLGRRYGNATLDVDMTGGYGANTVTALSQARYHNLVRDYHEDRPGVVAPRFGFTITAVNRSEITTAIERALLEDSVEMPSRAVIASLLGITVDARDKWLAGPGRHDEDMICLGRALHLMATLPAPAVRRKSGHERLMARLGLSAVRRPVSRFPQPRWNP